MTIHPAPAPGHRVRTALAVALALVLAGCSGTTTLTTPTAPGTTAAPSPTTAATSPPSTAPSGGARNSVADLPAVRTLLEAAAPLRRFSLGPDRLGVWVCHVAIGITDPIYNAADFRLPLTPGRVAELLTRHVTPYFEVLSGGRYQPQFVVGGEVSIEADQTNQDCVRQAQATSADDVDGLVVVADAEHGADRPGGWGRPGEPCEIAEPCPARVSGRATYIGASDFHPDWGDVPAVDLQEHELGHSLGLPHSGDRGGHTSGIDVMSNSAAPRDVDPTRRDGADTLAVNRLALGWLALTDATVGAPGRYRLSPSNGPKGLRLLVLPLDELRFVTVEVLENTGFDAHLPAPGVAVHLIDQRPEACRTDGSPAPCVNELRRQTPLHSPAPNTRLLAVGDEWSGEGWRVNVVSVDDGVWTVEIAIAGSTKESA